jgi:hypothetical protein
MLVTWRRVGSLAVLFVLSGCGVTHGADGGGQDGGRMDTGPSDECLGQPDGSICGTDQICVGDRCVTSSCGDGYLDGDRGEICDDGNDASFDGCEPDTCTYTCTSASECSDGDPCNGAEPCGETTHFCETGVGLPDGVRCVAETVSDGVCRESSCVPVGCGNGVLDGTEQCDDSADGDDADGCKDDCTFSCHTDADCDDGDVCDGTDSCNTTAHVCESTAALDCDDGDGCTMNLCDPVLGCDNPLIDGDGDGYPPDSIPGCGTDCDDVRDDVNPGHAELCDSIDHDCDGSPMSPADPFWFPDCDGDDYAPLDAAALGLQGCAEPPAMSGCAGGWTTRRPQSSMPTTLDCDDANAARNPMGVELVGDGIDHDCDLGELCYVDADDDGYRTVLTVASPDLDCTDSGEATAAEPATDCDDARAGTYPDATETCNGLDDDCDGDLDEGVRTTFYRDIDGDGYGVSGTTTQACTLPSGYATVAGDCNDGSAGVRPGASEACNGIDDDCAAGADDTFSCRFGLARPCSACGYDGTQRCGSSCEWGSCGGFTGVTRSYDDVATPFTHACGSACDDDWCITDAPSPGCNVISGGPGLSVPPGRYEADFYFGDSGTFDFYVLNGATQVGAVTGFVNSSGTFPHVLVPFTVSSGCGNISVRLYGRTGARIRLYSITLRRLGD